MSKKKIALFTLIFTLVFFVVPIILLVSFVSADDLGTYFAVFGLIYFASLGFVCANVVSIKKEVLKAVSEIKVQNAAIAYRLAKNKGELTEILSEETSRQEEKIDYSKVNLNPEEQSNVSKKDTKIYADDNFDDFK